MGWTCSVNKTRRSEMKYFYNNEAYRIENDLKINTVITYKIILQCVNTQMV